MGRTKNKKDVETTENKNSEPLKNTKVFILPPELLSQLGINLEAYQNSEQSNTKASEKEEESTNLSQIKKSLKDKLTDKINKKNKTENDTANVVSNDIVTTNEKTNQSCFRTPKVPTRFKRSSLNSQSPVGNYNPVANSDGTKPPNSSCNANEIHKDIIPLSNSGDVESPDNLPNILNKSENELNFSPGYLDHLEKTLDSDIQTHYQLTDSELAILNSPTLTNLETFEVQKDPSLITVEDNFNLYNVNQNSSEFNVENINSVPDAISPDPNYVPTNKTQNFVLPPFQSVISKTNQIPEYFYDRNTEYVPVDSTLPVESNVNQSSILFETSPLENDLSHQITENINEENSTKTSSDTNPKNTDNTDNKKNECFLKVMEYFKAFQQKKLNSDMNIVQEPTKSPQTSNYQNKNINYEQDENEPSTSKTVEEIDVEPNIELRVNSPNFGLFDEDTYNFANEQTSIINEIPNITDEKISKMDEELNDIESSKQNASLFEDSLDENNSSEDENSCLNKEFVLFQENLKFHQSNTGKRKLTKKFSSSTPYKTTANKSNMVKSVNRDLENDGSKLAENNVNQNVISPMMSPKNISHISNQETKALEINEGANVSSKEISDTQALKVRRSTRRTSRNTNKTDDQNLVQTQQNNEVQDVIPANVEETIPSEDKNDEVSQNKNELKDDSSLPPKKKFGRRSLNKNSCKDQNELPNILHAENENNSQLPEKELNVQISSNNENIIEEESEISHSFLNEDSQTNSVHEYEEEQIQDITLPEKKKGGRKKKAITQELPPQIEINVEPTEPKKRGQKRKKIGITEKLELVESESENTNSVNLSQTLETSEMNKEDDEPLAKFTGGRKKRYKNSIEDEPEETNSVILNQTLEISAIDEEKEIEKQPSRRGRKRKCERKRNTESKKAWGDTVVCAVCTVECKENQWLKHARKHNLLAWKVGEPPIDLDDDQTVSNMLFKKISTLKKLVCEKCGTSRLSVMGFVAHIRSCGKSEEDLKKYLVECPICSEMINKYSLQAHISQHKAAKKKEERLKQLEKENQNEKPIEEDQPLTKRRAAQKAINIIQSIEKSEPNDEEYKTWFTKFDRKMVPNAKMSWQKIINKFSTMDCIRGCGFSADNLEKMELHFKENCRYLNWLKCKVCSKAFPTKELIIEHLNKAHDNLLNKKHESESASSSEFEETEKSLDNCKVYGPDSIPRNEKKYKQLARDFLNFNFSTEQLFADMQCKKFIALPNDQISQYLPEKKESCHFSFTKYCRNIEKISKNQFEWKKFELFESTIHNGVQSFWCGGSIRSLAWTPSEDESNSFLAVAVDRLKNEKYLEYKLYSHNDTLQIWNCGNLSDASQCESPATLSMVIAHNYGVIWDMKWCPSGCYDKNEGVNKNLKRIGLLALACSSGFVHILAICDPNSFSKRESKFFQTEPVATLKLYDTDDTSLMLNGVPSYPTKLIWNEEKGHKMIIVGYSNGMLGYYNLTTTSPLLRSKKDNIDVFYPYNRLHAHNSAITGLSLMPRTQKLIEKDDDVILCTVCHYETSVWHGDHLLRQRTGHFSSSFTSPCYPQFYITANDLMTNLNKGSTCRITCVSLKNTAWPSLNHLMKQEESLPGSSQVCSCPWCGNVLSADAGGDIGYLPESHCFINTHRSRKNKPVRQVFTYPLLFAMNGEPIKSSYRIIGAKTNFTDECNVLENFKVNSLTYDEVVEQYGILHVDVHDNMYDKSGSYNKYIVKSPPLNHLCVDRYPLQIVECIAVNPADTKHKFLAYGGPSGLVRIIRHRVHPELLR